MTPYEKDDYLTRHFQTSDIDLLKKIEELISLATPMDSANLALYREMLITVVRMAQADRNRWDAKIMLQTLTEMERAFHRLEQFKRRRKVTVFGSARTPADHPLYMLARDLGRALSQYDLMVITGAGDGIMAAAHEGAGRDNSLGFNITLPFEQEANSVVQGSDRLLSFHFFFLRKLFFVKEADALVLFPGGFGTLDEALEVLTLIQTGKSPLVPIVLVDQPGGTYWQDALEFLQRQLADNHYILPADMHLMSLAHSVDDAVKEIASFYRNFHSSRWIKNIFVIRLRHALNKDALSYINEHFIDLCVSGSFSQQSYYADEQDEPELCHFTRLVLTFNGRDHGRLRDLVDFVNQSENWE